ncbi:MAG: 3-deoxy-D-manno-octulosonic acid transferase [Candidatus Omnitrophota bacterium]
MRLLYDIFFMIFGILYLPYLLARGKIHAGFFRKFGFPEENVTRLERPVWIHAVSVGEAVVAAKLALALKSRFGGVSVVVSTTTLTGNAMIRKCGRGTVDGIFYYPFDMSFIVSRVVRLLDPSLYVIIETELWPNLLGELSRREVPVVLVNGRISDRSFRNYAKAKGIVRRILECVTYFCMQSEEDAERIVKLGAGPERVCITGNIKFDGQKGVPEISGMKKNMLGFDDGDEILVAGSTHFPEETAIIDIYKELKKTYGGLKLVLAPRHIERTDAVRIYLEKCDLRYLLFSEISEKGGKYPGKTDVVLVDTIGHLRELYSIASLVFIGGSLAKRGGQNPIEAAGWGKAIIFGPNMQNFRKVADIFLENRAAVRVKDASELGRVFDELLRDPSKREQMAENAGKVIKNNSGALDRTVESISEVFRRGANLI